MRYSELLEYKRDITLNNFGEKFLRRMEQDETIADYITDGGLNSETGEPYTIDDELVQEFITTMIEQIEQADPSPNKQYVQWMLLRYIDGSIELFEDILSTTSEMLEVFHNLKVRRQLPPELSDINKFKGKDALWKLYDKVHSLWNAYQKKRGEETALAMPKGDSTELYSDANVRVIIPHNKEASCYYGQGTKWCTASTKGTNYFYDYNSRGKLYIFIPKNPTYEGEKYQLHDDGTFLNEKDQNVKGGLKWLLYERFPIKELRDLWIKFDDVITTDSVVVTTPSNGITLSMFGFRASRFGNKNNYIFVPKNPQHKGEQYTVQNDGSAWGEDNKQREIRWLFDERFTDKELKDKFINPSEVYTDNEVRVVQPSNTLTSAYYDVDTSLQASYVFEPKNPKRDMEEYNLYTNGELRIENGNTVKDGIAWLFDKRFTNQELKDKFIDVKQTYENNEVKVVRPNDYISRKYLGDYSNASEGYDMFIPKNPQHEGERYKLSDYGKVSLVDKGVVSYGNSDDKSVRWLFDVRFPNKKLKDEYIIMDKGVFENSEVSIDMTNYDNGYLAKLYIYSNEYPPEGAIYVIKPKQPTNDKEQYTFVIGENKIYNYLGHTVDNMGELLTQRFKDKSLLSFINKEFDSNHDINITDTIDFVPPNVLDDTLKAIREYAIEVVGEMAFEWQMDDDYYRTWLEDEGYVDEDGDIKDDAPDYFEYNTDASQILEDVEGISDIVMSDINDMKYNMRDEDGIFYLSELPEIVGAILKDNTYHESVMDEIAIRIEDLTIQQDRGENGNTSGVTAFKTYKDSDGESKRITYLEKSYEV